MTNVQQAFAILDPFCVVTRRSDERGAIIDGARDTNGNQLGMITCDDGCADAIELELDHAPSVSGLLSKDGRRIDLIRVHASDVLTDGRGRYFDIASRHPVDRHGNRVTLAQAEHNARNWAARHDKLMRKAA